MPEEEFLAGRLAVMDDLADGRHLPHRQGRRAQGGRPGPTSSAEICAAARAGSDRACGRICARLAQASDRSAPATPPSRPPGRTGGSPPSSTRSTRGPSPTATATASATSPASRPRWTTWPRSASTSSGCRRSTPRRRTTTATTSATTRTSTRLFGSLADLDALIAGAARARHEAGDGPGGQPHLRRARLVRGVARPGLAQARLVLVAAGPRGLRARRRGGRADQLGVRLLRARPGSSTSGAGSTTCTCSRRKQPDLNWENPEVRQAVYAMMNWWVDRGRRRLPDGRHQPDLQAARAWPTARPPPGRTLRAGVRLHRQRPAAARVPGTR